MNSHSDGELWGLDVSTFPHIVTSADDNQIITWDASTRKMVKSTPLTTTRQVAAKKGGASTLSSLPASQCSRAVVVQNGSIVAAGNDGAVTFNLGTSSE